MKIKAPLYRDPIYDGAADPMVIRKESDDKFYMFYTQRRANQQVENVSFCYGTKIGVAESEDGANWHYRGALDLDFEFGHNTFWAPEIIFNPEETLFMRKCAQAGARAFNGLKMLLYQGIAGFELWNNVKVSDELAREVLALMEKEMGHE